MALGLATVGAKITAALYNAIVNVVNLSSTSLIVPTTPTFTGTSGSMSTNGLITFTTCTVISVDAALPTQFRRHIINVQTLNATGTATFIFRTTAPADDVLTKYDTTQLLDRAAAVSGATTPGSASWPLTTVANTLTESKLELNGAAVAAPTTGFMSTGSHSNPAVSNATNASTFWYLTQQEPVAFGGFKITFSAACSGSIRIIGEY